MTVAPQGYDNAKPAPERRVRHGLIEDWQDAIGILLLLIVAAFFGALITRVWPASDDTPAGSSAEFASRLTTLEARLASPDIGALRDRLAKLEARMTGVETTRAAASEVPASADRSGELKRLEDLTTRLAELESKTATTPADILATKAGIETLTTATTGITVRIDEVDGRLAKLEASDLLALAKRASLAAAIANLTRAAQGSQPFKTEFDVVSALLPDDGHLAEIAPRAAIGLPTTGTLIATFANQADASLDAENLSRGKTWGTQLWANFSSLVSWRTTGEAQGNTTESRLARAEVRLKVGDLQAAVAELSSIKGAARKPLAQWLANASARVKVEAALAALNTQAIEAITGSTDTSKPVPQPSAP